MRAVQPLRLSCGILLAILVIYISIGPVAILAKQLPSDRCALLPASELQKVLGGSFGQPTSHSAPPPYRNVPAGTECDYGAAQGDGETRFIVYVDPSAAIAKETFEKLMMWFPAKSKLAHLGDNAYIDKGGAIHVLKGSVRFYIGVTPDAKDAQLVDLATSVLGRL